MYNYIVIVTQTGTNKVQLKWWNGGNREQYVIIIARHPFSSVCIGSPAIVLRYPINMKHVKR